MMRDWLIPLGVVIAVGAGVTACIPEMEAAEKKLQAEAAANKVPRIVSRSSDGCDVYAFNPGDRWRYFTRCGSQVTTDNTYEVKRTSGKTTTTEVVPDSISTEVRR